jgi:hypothetical protein
MNPICVAAFHQSPLGKLLDIPVPQIIERAVTCACREIAIDASSIDVGSVAAACNFTLNQQGCSRA